MIAIWLLMLLALVGLGSLAALVFGIVYAIVNKRPGVAVASVLVPGAVLIGGALLVTLFARTSAMVQLDSPAHVSWTGGPSMPPMPPMPAMPPMPPMPQVSVNGLVLASWIKLAIVLLVCFGVVQLFRKRTSCNGERRGGWGKTLVVAVLLILAANFLVLWASHDTRQVAVRRVEATQVQENAKLQELEAERRADEDRVRQQEEQQRLKESLERAAAQAVEGKSMQELWEKLNEPRIKLESDDHGASLTMGARANPIAIVTPEAGGAKLVVPISEKTPESLARSLTRLERMVEQVSAVADKVSDAGTLVGKAMIALNDTMDSPRTAARQPAVAVQAAAAVSPPMPPAVESHATAAVEVSRPPADDEDNETYSSLKLVSEHSPIDDTTAVSPEWIEIPPGRIGNVWREVVVTEEYATPDECARAADVYLLLKTYEHFAQMLDNPRSENTLPTLSFNTKERGAITADGKVIYEQRGNTGVWHDERIRTLANMGIGIDFIRREVVPDNREYYETTQRSVGEMKKLYTMLEFTPSVDAELLRRWDELRRQDRFAVVGAGAGSVLGLIGLAFGLLKVDTWTRGYYTKRLFFGVPAAIIGLVGLLSLAAG